MLYQSLQYVIVNGSLIVQKLKLQIVLRQALNKFSFGERVARCKNTAPAQNSTSLVGEKQLSQVLWLALYCIIHSITLHSKSASNNLPLGDVVLFIQKCVSALKKTNRCAVNTCIIRQNY